MRLLSPQTAPRKFRERAGRGSPKMPTAPHHASQRPAEGEEILPPENFAMVWRGVYRSGFPTKKNLAFLQQLGLRSILFLCPEEYPDSHLGFLEEQGVQLLHFGVTGNKEPFDEMSDDIVRAALRAVIDPANHPVLIHCNQGKHRTGCLVGCLRRMQRWSLVAICDEYRRFAGSKARVVDQQFIERFRCEAPPASYPASSPLPPPPQPPHPPQPLQSQPSQPAPSLLAGAEAHACGCGGAAAAPTEASAQQAEETAEPRAESGAEGDGHWAHHENLSS